MKLGTGLLTMEAVGLVVVVILLCFLHVTYVIVDSDQDRSVETGQGDSNTVSLRQRRQTPGEDYTYTLEVLIVVDPAVFSWFKSLIRPRSEGEMTEEATNKTLRHYLRVFHGIKTRFVTSTELDLDLVLVDIIIPENLSFPSPIPFTPSPRSLITAPEVLDTFRNWVNTTELPNHDHALLFTGYNLTYGGSASSTGLSYPDSVCTELAMSVVEESYDERTPLYAAQELGRSLGSRLDMDGNFCRATNLNIMSTKFVFNSPKVSNLWKFSRCSLSYIREFLQKLDSGGSDCLRKHSTISSLALVPPTPDVDTQCRTAFGLDSFLCRALTGTDYSALCGGMECYLPESGACARVLPLDGTVCGNFSICSEGECVFTNEGRNVPDECPFGDQPELPGSVGCVDRVYGRPYDCYLSSLNAACCASCGEIKTDIKGCEYGDRTDRCQFSKCPSYNNSTRENLCCLTCKNGKLPYSASTVTPISSTSSESVYNVTSDDAKSTENGTSLIKTTTSAASTSSLPSTTDSTSRPQISTTKDQISSTTAQISTSARLTDPRTEGTSASTASVSTQETGLPFTTQNMSSEPTSRIPVKSSAVISSSATAEILSTTRPTTRPTITTTTTTEETTDMSSVTRSDSTTTSLWTNSDVTSTQVTTSSGSNEGSSCEDGSGEQSSEKEKQKKWKKMLKKLEKERKKSEKRMKDLQKKYDKMMKKLRKFLGIDFSTLL